MNTANAKVGRQRAVSPDVRGTLDAYEHPYIGRRDTPGKVHFANRRHVGIGLKGEFVRGLKLDSNNDIQLIHHGKREWRWIIAEDSGRGAGQRSCATVTA